MPLRYDQEWRFLAGPSLASQGEELPVGDAATRRERFESLFVNYDFKVPEDIGMKIHRITAADGHEIEVFQLSSKTGPPEAGRPTAAVLHIHGGGFIAVKARSVLGSLVPFVRASNVPFFSVDYRLAPENPFPTPVEDCWAALQYLHLHADTLNIDRSRLAVMGESAGGGLAAGLAILARDHKLSPPLAKQILLYPMLDDRTVADDSGGLAIFSINDVLTGWQAYLGKDYNSDQVSPVAAPARVIDVSGLPDLYLDVGQLDGFLHEDLSFANKFLASSIQTELHVYPGVIHAFQRWSPDATVVKKAFSNRLGSIMAL